MSADPVENVGGLNSTAAVSKADFRAYEKKNLYWFESADDVRNTDLSGRNRIMVGSLFYEKDTGDVSVDDGSDEPAIIIDSAGNHWVRIQNVSVAVDAVGTFSGRSAYDAEAQGFVYLSTDGNVSPISDAVLFVKLTSTSGDWSSPILIRGPSGGDRYEFGNWDTDRPASGEELVSWIFTTTVTFLAGLPSSQAKARVASTGAAVYSIQKNDVEVGTITFTASVTGVLAQAADQTYVAGDRLSIIAPDPRDATLSGAVMTLVGTR